MKTTILRLSALAAVATVLPLAAQTPTKPVHPMHSTTEHSAYAARHACATLPEISSAIPALPAGTPCAKVLYTLTRKPDTTLDYASPLVSPELRESLGVGPETFSLDYIDTHVGTGELVQPKKYLTVRYTGYLAADGKKFDSSDDHPNKEPISFPYGMHRVIQGWDTGFEGMHVGGKRRIFIPYELAYGDSGRPPTIPAKSELVFDVELVSLSDKEPERKMPPRPMPLPKPESKPMTTKPATPPAGTAPQPKPASTTPPPAPTTK